MQKKSTAIQVRQEKQWLVRCTGRAWVLLSHSHTRTHNVKLVLCAALQAQELATAFTGERSRQSYSSCSNAQHMLRNLTDSSTAAAHALQAHACLAHAHHFIAHLFK
jgi:hypothetical protein